MPGGPIIASCQLREMGATFDLTNLTNQRHHSDMALDTSTEMLMSDSTLDNERRIQGERRRRLAFSLAYGGVRPRRRQPRRGEDDFGFFADWHEPHLLYSVMGILLLCGTDAVLTLNLLQHGAVELNPLMATLIQHDTQLFAAIKMATTGLALISLVVLANFRVFRRIRVYNLVYGAFFAYLALIFYELLILSSRI